MARDLREIRERAGVSRAKAAAAADVTETTARVYELDPDAIRERAKRDALDRVYAGFERGEGAA
jgi:hypothetical protein